MVQDTATRERVLSYVRHQATKSLADLAALMERTGADCARCLEGVGEEQADFSYDEEWSIKDVLGHMIASGKGINREITNLVEGRPERGEARTGVVVGADRPTEELRQALAEIWSETTQLVASLPEDGNVERTWAHPWFGELNFRQWIPFQRLHAMDHIQQMEKLKAHPDYPRPGQA